MHVAQRMRKPLAVMLAAALAGCGTAPSRQSDIAPAAIVASPLEPAAQLGAANANYIDGALVGAAGGAGVAAMSAQASAGLLCTLGGPLCWVVMVPAAVVGGVVGGVAGAAVDAVTTDPLGRVAAARDTIDQAIAQMRLTDALAAATSRNTGLPLASREETPAGPQLEIAVSELQILQREKDMALRLKGQARLYRSPGGELLEERAAEARTEFRRYRDWAADGAQPLRRAVDEALAQLSRSLVSAPAAGPLRAGSATRRDG